MSKLLSRPKWEKIVATGGPMKALALALVLFLPAVLLAKLREWKNATVAAITLGSADSGAAVVPVGTVWLGVRITTDCIGYRIETEDMIYILEYCYNPIVQHPWPGQHSRNRAPDVTLNGKTKIAIDGHDAYILDDSGKEVKVPIMEKVAKPKNKAPA
jgi:hypothetical protein